MPTRYWDRMNVKLRALAENREKFTRGEQYKIMRVVDLKRTLGRISPSHVQVVNDMYEKLKGMLDDRNTVSEVREADTTPDVQHK